MARVSHQNSQIGKLRKTCEPIQNLKPKLLLITAGSKSMNAARGTKCPDSHSSKIVWKLSSPSLGHFCLASTKFPSGRIPCSRQYNSQIELPICAPAWPIWMEMVSRCTKFQLIKNTRFSSKEKRRLEYFLFQGETYFWSVRKYPSTMDRYSKLWWIITAHSRY